jgi:tripartite-type tricarboxylate transporter receptor subunit TctC
MRRAFVPGAWLALAVLGGAPAWAAEYPAREIEMIVSFPAGGPADASARILAPVLSRALGVPIAVVNKTGGGGSVGADYVAKAKPDGATIYNSTNSALTISPVILKDISYKIGDFTPIGAYAADLGVITVRAGGPARTLEEFVDHARKNPGKLTYGSAGLGTVSFFTMELFKLAYGLDITHVPFQGTGPVKNAILGGHVTVATSGLGSLAPLIRSGDLVPLVTTAPKRVAAFPPGADDGRKGISRRVAEHLDGSLRPGPHPQARGGGPRAGVQPGGEGSGRARCPRQGRDAGLLSHGRGDAEAARERGRDRGARRGQGRIEEVNGTCASGSARSSSWSAC